MPAVAEVTGSPGVRHDGFRRFAWGVLAYNVLVVLWGAYVRASGSGAGCGSHWPLCNGEVVPLAPKIETVIEFAHRVTSGLAVISAAALCVWSFRVFPRGHRGRKTAVLAIVFLMMEALLGAGLVLFRYVAQGCFGGARVYLSAHLMNTQLLLGMLAATAWLAGQDDVARRPGSARKAVLIGEPGGGDYRRARRPGRYAVSGLFHRCRHGARVFGRRAVAAAVAPAASGGGPGRGGLSGDERA